MTVDQEIYQAIGKLLWSVMPHEALVINFYGSIYADSSGHTVTFEKKSGELSWFDFDDNPDAICKEIMELASLLLNTELFSKEPWSHFKASLSETGKFKIDFAYIPQRDSWPGLFMKRVSELTKEEAKKYFISEVDWADCVKEFNNNTGHPH